MAKIELHPDFKDFLRLLNLHNVRYLLVGGYAVGYHGYPQATGDMEIWIEISEVNSKKYDSRNCRHLREVTVIAGRLQHTDPHRFYSR